MSSDLGRTIHRGDLRGHVKIDWLDSYHTFSFGSFQDPTRMGFRSIRVINEDRVIPGKGFNTHSHKDMEILTYVISGAIEHRDSMGNGEIIYPGDVQIMSAGTGITHSEFNPSQAEELHLLQIWILPDRSGITPRYEQKSFPPESKRGKFRLIGSKDGREGAVVIHQDVLLYAAILEPGEAISQELSAHRYAWLQVVTGIATIDGEEFRSGDAVQIVGQKQLNVSTQVGTEVLLFDLG
jgi:quercetin 2,3-dioxygenase